MYTGAAGHLQLYMLREHIQHVPMACYLMILCKPAAMCKSIIATWSITWNGDIAGQAPSGPL